jgi:uncharacterized protein YbaR (Trm112 family)
MPLDPLILEICVCPADHGALRLEGDPAAPTGLTCQRCGRRYPVRDDIPVLLIEEAELPDGAEPPAPA